MPLMAFPVGNRNPHITHVNQSAGKEQSPPVLVADYSSGSMPRLRKLSCGAASRAAFISSFTALA
eukprot:m.159082 g.159082  ORF g.159082 m.159082 type:complete len:65 (+) comp16481_c0_seq1:83-277(+)